jgi:transcriptional antiterminator Rof (Rho-off)
MSTDYQPINCYYYDLLELAALRRREVEVRFSTTSGAEQLRRARIEDL